MSRVLQASVPSVRPWFVPGVGLLVAGVLGLGLVATAAVEVRGADRAAPPDSLQVQAYEAAFVQGNAEALLRNAASRVELSLFGRAAFYSRTQALFVMRDFFRRYPPAAATFRDQSIGSETRTLLGQYTERGGSQCSVAVRLRQRAGVWEVIAVRLDRVPGSVAGVK